MVLNRNRPPYVLSKRVKVHRAKALSDQLANLRSDDLRLLRRFIRDPKEPGIQQILAKPVLAEYTIQELQVALAMLSGVGELPPAQQLPPAGTVQLGSPVRPTKRTISPEFSFISNHNWQMPSRLSPEIAQRLEKMPEDEFLWLAQHLRYPTDARTRFIMIRYHLYRYQPEDLASTMATLIRLKRRGRRVTKKERPSRMSLSSPKFH
ncbi:MAG: hypothetical protein ACFE8O_00165 [Candidatus Hermodarchaeota archaeon]